MAQVSKLTCLQFRLFTLSSCHYFAGEFLEDLLRALTPEKLSIGDAMVWCVDHADCAKEIVECLAESLEIDETPLHKKVRRRRPLFLRHTTPLSRRSRLPDFISSTTFSPTAACALKTSTSIERTSKIYSSAFSSHSIGRWKESRAASKPSNFDSASCSAFECSSRTPFIRAMRLLTIKTFSSV